MAFFDQKHGLTPLKKCVFFELWKILFFKVKNVSFFSAKWESIISRLILIKFKLKIKLAFFWQKYGLTPLKKSDFLDIEKCCFSRSKKVSFFSAKSESIISSVILIKSNKAKSIGSARLEKMRSFGLWNILFFYSQKGFFCLFKVINHYF